MKYLLIILCSISSHAEDLNRGLLPLKIWDEFSEIKLFRNDYFLKVDTGSKKFVTKEEFNKMKNQEVGYCVTPVNNCLFPQETLSYMQGIRTYNPNLSQRSFSLACLTTKERCNLFKDEIYQDLNYDYFAPLSQIKDLIRFHHTEQEIQQEVVRVNQIK